MSAFSDLFDIQNYLIIIAASLAIVIAFAKTSAKTTSNLFIGLSGSLMLITIISIISAPTQKPPNTPLSFGDIISKILFALPLLPITILSIILVSLELEYEDIISSDVKPDSYEIVKDINFLLMLIVLIVIYSYIKDSKKLVGLSSEAFEKKMTCLNSSASIIYFFSFLTYISSTFMFIILKYFSTDG